MNAPTDYRSQCQGMGLQLFNIELYLKQRPVRLDVWC